MLEPSGHLTLRGTVWTLAGYGASQCLRLAGNLVLTRLLFPEAFGLMALVGVLLQGLEMFSDVGIGVIIVQHKRGDDPAFLNTVWTVQIVRGATLWVLSCVLAWPVAAFYEAPQLAGLLPVVGLTTLVSGFNSTSQFTLQRRLQLARLVVLEVGTQALAISTMAVWSWLHPTIWALVGGNLLRVLVKMVLSHVVLPGIQNRVCWDRESGLALLRFGRWIFLSTMLAFVASQADRLVVGKWLTMSEFGVYNIAVALATVGVGAVQHLAAQVLFPVYAGLADAAGDLRRRTIRLRAVLLAVLLPPLAVLVACAPALVAFLYDERYLAAGWMLQVLGAGALVRCINLTISPLLLASGDSFRHMVVMGVRSVALLAGMGIGHQVAGAAGLVTGVALAPVLSYPALAWAVRRHGVWTPILDVGAALGAAALAASLMLL